MIWYWGVWGGPPSASRGDMVQRGLRGSSIERRWPYRQQTPRNIHQIQEQACFWYTFCISYLSDTVIEEWHGFGNTYAHCFLQPPYQCHARRSRVWLRKNDANEAALLTKIHYCEIKPARVSATSVCTLI